MSHYDDDHDRFCQRRLRALDDRQFGRFLALACGVPGYAWLDQRRNFAQSIAARRAWDAPGRRERSSAGQKAAWARRKAAAAVQTTRHGKHYRRIK